MLNFEGFCLILIICQFVIFVFYNRRSCLCDVSFFCNRQLPSSVHQPSATIIIMIIRVVELCQSSAVTSLTHAYTNILYCRIRGFYWQLFNILHFIIIFATSLDSSDYTETVNNIMIHDYYWKHLFKFKDSTLSSRFLCYFSSVRENICFCLLLPTLLWVKDEHSLTLTPAPTPGCTLSDNLSSTRPASGEAAPCMPGSGSYQQWFITECTTDCSRLIESE